MPRLPIVGSDDGTWGTYLNEFLEVSLDNTNVDEAERGKLKSAAVDDAGAVMNSDTSTASMSFVVDEDNMASNSATKVPTQQSVKAYADTKETKAKVTPIAVSTATAAATAAKVATTVGGSYIPVLGDIIFVTFTTANTATNPTINIDGSGAKSILLGNLNPTGVAMAGTKVMMWYDGTAFQLFGSQRVSDTDTNTTYIEATAFATVSGTTQAAAVNQGYIANNAAQVNVTLPGTVAIGQIVHVLGLGAGGWRVTAPSGDNIILEGNSTGAAGYIYGGQYASVALRCIVANATWEVVSYTGDITTGVGYSTAKQPLDADLTTLAGAGNSTVLAATTASFLTADETKLDGIEALADVTDATNVDAAGAVMNTDTATTDMQFVVDEDDMVSNSDTKIPTQQSVKAYVDNLSDAEIAVTTSGNTDIDGANTVIQYIAGAYGAGSQVGNMDNVQEYLYGLSYGFKLYRDFQDAINVSHEHSVGMYGSRIGMNKWRMSTRNLKHIVCWGDSVTQGVGVDSKTRSMTDGLRQILTNEMNEQVHEGFQPIFWLTGATPSRYSTSGGWTNVTGQSASNLSPHGINGSQIRSTNNTLRTITWTRPSHVECTRFYIYWVDDSTTTSGAKWSYSTDGGTTWTEVATTSPGTPTFNATEVVLDPSEHNPTDIRIRNADSAGTTWTNSPSFIGVDIRHSEYGWVVHNVGQSGASLSLATASNSCGAVSASRAGDWKPFFDFLEPELTIIEFSNDTTGYVQATFETAIETACAHLDTYSDLVAYGFPDQSRLSGGTYLADVRTHTRDKVLEYNGVAIDMSQRWTSTATAQANGFMPGVMFPIHPTELGDKDIATAIGRLLRSYA